MGERTSRAAAGALTLAGLAACGSGSPGSTSAPASTTAPPLGAAGAAALVAERQRAATPGLQVGEASCAEAAPGAGFTCTISVEGVAVRWTVVVSASGETQASPIEPAIEVARAVEAVRREFAAEGPVGTIDCGGARVVVLPVDEELTCTIVDGQRRRTVHVVVLDREGALRVVP